jgi:CubicO group peptidase (beta-lactamase class C family)
MKSFFRNASCIGAVFVLVAAAAAQAAAPPDLDAWVARAMQQFDAPALAVGIVKDGKVVVAKGYGVRKLSEPAQVDADTLFGIASNTKAFTATALATLVDQGKIRWDEPVINYLPYFRMSDPYVTHEITVRDLLVHRSGLGLGEGDLLYFPRSTFTRDEIVRRVRYLPLVTSFRSHYAYDNILYVVAGQVLAVVMGKSWDDAIRERIFQPLGMRHSNTTVRDLQPGINYATPTAIVDGKLQSVPFEVVDNAGAAGAINSCASDMVKWLLVQLSRGRIVGGHPLFSAEQSNQLWSGVTILPPAEDVPPQLAVLRPQFSEYALGFNVRDYRGHKIVAHTGGLTGYTSRVLMIPERNVGIVVLTNSDEAEGHEAVALHIADYYLGVPPVDWISAFATARAAKLHKAERTEQREQAARNANSHPSLPLSGYTGEYADAWYGKATVAIENQKLVMRFSRTPGLTGRLEHFQYDTFIAHWADRNTPEAYVMFQLDQHGHVDQIKLAPVSPLADFSYDYQDLLFRPVPPIN